MKMSDLIFEEISMIDVLEKYHHVGKYKRTSCPLHDGEDNNFCYTEKVYHCWSCGASGNVARFVMELFGLSFIEACIKINDDFKMDIPINSKPTYRQKEKVRERLRKIRAKKEYENRRKQSENDRYDRLISEYTKWDRIRILFAPKTPKEPIDDLYVRAIHKLPYIEHRMDIEDWRISNESIAGKM